MQPWVLSGPEQLKNWSDRYDVDRADLARLWQGLEITACGEIPRHVPAGQLPTIYVPGLSAVPWWEREAFPWLSGLESAAPAITAEFEALGGVAGAGTVRSPSTGSVDRGSWSARYLYNVGRPQARHLRSCPRTVAALGPIPGALGCGMCYFSIAGPQTHITAHTGYTNAHLRCHLSLVVPPGCAIRVGREVREWEERTAFVFDDSFEHEVWNNSDSARAVLLFDIWHPDLTAIERAALGHLMDVWRRQIYRTYWAGALVGSTAATMSRDTSRGRARTLSRTDSLSREGSTEQGE
ncbi:aspartyl/asparaginyl beta-hydroxylase domain-containing protein [Nocardia wallacei]|uniref:aspartyl/asparaginyl beta-hydroxylase domain-containing protein n=1 Tax=Nocardia wallacei TaxID=480035 RepID=UPI00245651EF|nr:aspartyl/asparaginyl beta-hydroxylase domain-containing protein [Nocardia wallacei]